MASTVSGHRVTAARDIAGLAKRAIEERVVARLLGPDAPDFVEMRADAIARLRAADWRALSAARATRLPTELLFVRVFAVRDPLFLQNYRNAELDMHFSLSTDLVTVHDFFGAYKAGGLHFLTSTVSRSEFCLGAANAKIPRLAIRQSPRFGRHGRDA